MPEIIIESVDFRRAWDYVSSGEYYLLKEYLSEKVHRETEGESEKTL
jgi:aspartate racemase